MKKTTYDMLEQIQKGNYSDRVNVFISNNGSSDSTKKYIEDLVESFPNIEIYVNNFEKNQGPDANFSYMYSVADGRFTYLKGDDDYLACNGLQNIFAMIELFPEAGVFIGSMERVDKKRKVTAVSQHVRDVAKFLEVDFDNILEARNYFALADNILALGSFISCVVVRTEALKISPIDIFKTSNYVHIYYYWKYLTEGHKLVYSALPMCQPVIDEHESSHLSMARLSWDVRMCVLLADTFFKGTSLKVDICRIVQRMHSDIKYVPRDERKQFKEQLLPWIQKAHYPSNLLYGIKKRATSFGLFKYFIASLLPYKLLK